jgi:hypothetical protein
VQSLICPHRKILRDTVVFSPLSAIKKVDHCYGVFGKIRLSRNKSQNFIRALKSERGHGKEWILTFVQYELVSEFKSSREFENLPSTD